MSAATRTDRLIKQGKERITESGREEEEEEKEDEGDNNTSYNETSEDEKVEQEQEEKKEKRRDYPVNILGRLDNYRRCSAQRGRVRPSLNPTRCESCKSSRSGSRRGRATEAGGAARLPHGRQGWLILMKKMVPRSGIYIYLSPTRPLSRWVWAVGEGCEDHSEIVQLP